MSRLDYDVVFYRVFCVTLLAVAFTFTVILTNVFVDIDGLLSNKNKYIPETTMLPGTFKNNEESLIEEPKDITSDEDKNYDSEISPSYKTKRSIEPETTFRAKSPAMKKMLTRRLASLLEELDEQEAKKEVKSDITTTKAQVTKIEEDGTLGIKNEELFHLAMHNILLQGLIGHMDLNDVYKKVHELIQTFNKNIGTKKAQDEKLNILKSILNSKELLKDVPDLVKSNEEHKFFDELIKCKDLEEQISKNSLSDEINATNKNQNRKDDKVFIKTIIEINEKDNRPKASNISYPKENVEGLIKLIYNGKPIKVTQMHDEINSQNTKSKSKAIINNEIEKNTATIKDNKMNSETRNMKINNQIRRHQSSLLLNKVLEEYLKKHSLPNFEYMQSSAEVESIKTQRLKRQIKIRYSNNVTSSKTKPVHEGDKKDDDDLFIEIETHYDGKGIKGEKKKKLVRSLIDKIQKALHSDIEEKHDSIEHIKFVKRTQDSIFSMNKMPVNNKKPLEPIEHRLLDPIGKTLEYHENIADRLGDSWKKQSNGPNFLSVSKAVNSAEMNEVNIDYNRVLRNGIPKRLQLPLNTDDESDTTGLLNPNSGNVTLFLKDIGGSGFSIGFNKYEGEPPDNDSMKMFNGLENLIKEYHKTYDQDDHFNNEAPANQDNNVEETYHEMAKRNVENLHKVYRRSIPEVGYNYYNTNILKIFFKEKPSFNNYLNIFKRHNHKFNLHSRQDNVHSFAFHRKDTDIPLLSTNLSHKQVPIILNERILNKTLRSTENLSTADLVNRKKRSVSVKKISNLKSKIKLNRYLNTKAMENKKVFIKNKRNKRHVNNIRIIARDKQQGKPSQKNSDENIFFISKENSYKETVIGPVETADTNMNQNTEYIDDESPFSNIYRIQNPNIQTGLTEGAYDTAIRSNRLMSKYPHIFLDKSSNSKEDIYFDENQYRSNDRPYRIEASPKSAIGKQETERTTENNLATVFQDLSVPKVEEMVGAMMPPLRGTNYKITVKMSPKNKTNTNAGFKEIHTSVNKSYDDNGLRYYTLLNVSQISKIEKLNKTDETREVVQPLNDHLINQQEQIKALLKLHKKQVDLQLNSLLRESNHLEKIIESNKVYNIDKTVMLLTDDDGMDTANEEKLLDSVRKMQETHSTESKHLTTTPTTSKPISVLPSITETATIDKFKIIDTIKHNENVTYEILKKIDTNTQILQTFLQKISGKLEFDKNEHTTAKPKEQSALEIKLDLSKDWKSYGVHKDAYFIPNELKNNTIPFVYAYQQSIPMKNKSPSESLASLVYHGHIHTNAVQNMNNYNFQKPTPKVEPSILLNTDHGKRKFNESKFFVDGINNFKVIPSKDRVISANINTTNSV